jgi:hypothetical protein
VNGLTNWIGFLTMWFTVELSVRATFTGLSFTVQFYGYSSDGVPTTLFNKYSQIPFCFFDNNG